MARSTVLRALVILVEYVWCISVARQLVRGVLGFLFPTTDGIAGQCLSATVGVLLEAALVVWGLAWRHTPGADKKEILRWLRGGRMSSHKDQANRQWCLRLSLTLAAYHLVGLLILCLAEHHTTGNTQSIYLSRRDLLLPSTASTLGSPGAGVAISEPHITAAGAGAMGAGAAVGAALELMIGAPLKEEALFRWALFEGFLQEGGGAVGGGVVGAGLWAAAAFGAMHLTNVVGSRVLLRHAALQTVLGSLQGFVYSMIYVLTGSLRLPILLHSLNNFISLLEPASRRVPLCFGGWGGRGTSLALCTTGAVYAVAGWVCLRRVSQG
ncbi:unnamed protein product, partial [Discosporangium mesarthrocarpum]